MRLRRLRSDEGWTLATWGTAAAVYITIGVFFTDFMLSIAVAIGYVLITTWLIPGLIRRLR